MSWISTVFFVIFFAFILIGFHPIYLATKPFGQRALLTACGWMNWCILVLMRLSGIRIKTSLPPLLSAQTAYIVVSNHQSLFDIPLIVWYLRKISPLLIAKKELGSGIPSVSFLLRNAGYLLIDRDDREASVKAISVLAKRCETSNFSPCIFPEGTRARDGQIKRFKPAGFAALLEGAPTLPILPVVIDGSWKIVSKRFLPIPRGIDLSFTVLEPIHRQSLSSDEVMKLTELKIKETLTTTRKAQF